jgi:Predicted membrane protein (DUF2127)
VYWVSQHALLDLVQAITQAELAKDPRDLVANYLLHLAQNLSIGAQRFTAFFLLSHGVVKLWLIIGLLRQKLWYYPLAAAVFGLFIVYQLYRYSFTNSLWLLVLSAQLSMAACSQRGRCRGHCAYLARISVSEVRLEFRLRPTGRDRGVIRGDRDTISIEISARNSHKGDAGMTVI